ncbi:hypothetical protein A3F28_01530 [Candidatus Uhrbacteria bacterium RIFCSPHIGHO2_12_FULL_57_11]|uniref:Glycosyl transferase family 1 domain-containing protein n=2 Tax=Candidatus Uhriibacteriota TaxID=1752732 RepID=A0A1F7UL07_9BACT|nr:MAG: hypothetical protein A3D72_01390 [Candidatus Uhrbacteria bacterium RIFCSPHIGHO2_02_FULL_57_19]OGL78963.1 MAG: hypothetical protein A3F28_01530 [Candidatus Uhrbacteria bacterium RIFCSPHIGHO2_12_FULL_57_11]
MKRMLLVTLDFPPLRGGVARYYAGLLGAFPPESVAVLAEPAPEDEKFDVVAPYRVIRKRILGRLWPRWKWVWLRIMRVRRRTPFEVLLVGQVLPLGYAALTLRLLFRISYVVFVHGLDLLSARRSPWKRFWAERILRGASLVVANSGWTKARALEFGARDGRIEIIHPCPRARPLDRGSVERIISRWNLAGKRVILSVGRLVSRKGHDMMIEALPDIIRSHPSVIWIVVGDGPEGERLRHAVSKRALANHVVFTNVLNDEDLAAAYAAADVFVLPTREEEYDAEGFGLVFLEAGAAGVSVVAGRGGGVDEAVVDGVTGLLIDPRDPIAIARAVNRILSDKELARRMGDSGRSRVENHFQWLQQSSKLESSIKQTVS